MPVSYPVQASANRQLFSSVVPGFPGGPFAALPWGAYGAWGEMPQVRARPGFGRAYGAGDYSLTELAPAVAAQIAKAAAGVRLSQISAEPHPPDMFKGAADTGGAHYRAAYWLAVAARINPDASGLVGAAYKESMLAGADQTWLGWAMSSSSAADIRTILVNAAKLAQGAGVSEVASQLLRISSPAMTQSKQQEASGDWTIANAPNLVSRGFFPDWTKLGLTVAIVGVILIVLAGMIGFKYRKPLGRAASIGARGAALVAL